MKYTYQCVECGKKDPCVLSFMDDWGPLTPPICPFNFTKDIKVNIKSNWIRIVKEEKK